MLKINEIFFSAQGEGMRVGVPSVFIRLTGCSALCSYCDTKDSWKEGEELTESAIIKQIEDYKTKYKKFQIVITGGEPFEQNIKGLIVELKHDNYFVAVETNGKNFIQTEVDWFTISPKDVYDYHINKNFFDKVNEIKLIVNENLGIDTVNKMRRIGNDFPIFLQPDFLSNDKYKKTFDFYTECVKKGIENIRLGFQLHRLYGIE